MSEKVHSILGASGAHRWMNCPGVIRLTKDMPEIKSSYAKEGTDAHALGEYCLKMGFRQTSQVTTVPVKKPEDAFDITQDMREAVQVYLDHCYWLLDLTLSASGYVSYVQICAIYYHNQHWF